MEFPTLVKELEQTEEFKTWKTKHAKSFLAHVFVMIEQDTASGYQVGYMDTQNQKVTSFMITLDKQITILPPSEVLKDPDSQLQALDVENVEFSVQDIMTRAHEIRTEDYNGVPVMKVFCILQTIEGLGTVFNITFVTQDLKTLNIKLDAYSGEVVHHSMESLIHRDK